MTRPKIQLGDHVKDLITGFHGIAVCKTDWLNGCCRVGVQSQSLDSGKLIDIQTFDIEQLEILEASKVKLVKPPTGGPTPSVRDRQDQTFRP